MDLDAKFCHALLMIFESEDLIRKTTFRASFIDRKGVLLTESDKDVKAVWRHSSISFMSVKNLIEDRKHSKARFNLKIPEQAYGSSIWKVIDIMCRKRGRKRAHNQSFCSVCEERCHHHSRDRALSCISYSNNGPKIDWPKRKRQWCCRYLQKVAKKGFAARPLLHQF